MSSPTTVVLDIGGTSIKAGAFDVRGDPLADRMRVPVRYPLRPGDLVDRVADLTARLPVTDRASVGFPGVVRAGRVVTAPEFVAVVGLGSACSPNLLHAWTGFDLAGTVAQRVARPTLVVNDADLQGLGTATGVGLELVVTLGAGFGTAVLLDGALCPHLELAHHPFRDGETYNEQLGDAARRRVGDEAWTRRVRLALEALRVLLTYDRAWVLGGNSRRLTGEVGACATVVDDEVGLLGGVHLWSTAAHGEPPGSSVTAWPRAPGPTPTPGFGA